MATDLHAIPREVWRGFVDGGGLDRVELLRYYRALTTVQLQAADRRAVPARSRRGVHRHAPGFLVIWAGALEAASRPSLSAEQTPSFRFFFNSWNQGTLTTVLYPSIALHLRPRIELGGKRIDEPAFTRPLMSEVMAWLTAKRFFVRETTVASYGYEARLSCAATGMLNQALGKRGWLNTIFDKVVVDQRLPPMSACLEQVVVRGNQLAAFAERGRASGSADARR